MRIVIDLQSPQGASKSRGMGRYSLSLAKAMAKIATNHEIWIALNGLFLDTIEVLRTAFDRFVPPEQVVVWETPGPVAAFDPANTWRRETAELMRESFLASLKPDVLHVSSLFEGLGDNCITSIGKGTEVIPTAVTLYDLIPLIFDHIYLQGPQEQAWYYQKLQWLKNADLWLAISEYSRQDAIERLSLPEDRVINISGGFDSMLFRQLEVDPEREKALRTCYGLSRPFVVYVGGIDPRKNIEGLIQAYACLPRSFLKAYQLVIVCDIQEHDRRRLLELAKREGLQPDDVVFTGFVPDEDLVTFYNLCTLFVFPSLYEGFALPPLEAMACGAPVITSNTSSLPEVVGWEEALFDPKSQEAIAGKMCEALTDETFREALRKRGLEQAKRFSWEESARRALKAFEDLHAEKTKTRPYTVRFPISKPKLAYISPLPPARSGIADYSRELLPELARYYQIELIVDQPEVSDPWSPANFPVRTVEWFEKNADRFDRILYHFGNSEYHKHMFGLLTKHPGAAVLHDFYLSGVLHWMDRASYAPGVFRRELYRSHGYSALAELAERGEEDIVWKYPCNLSAIEGADGIIVHSRHAVELADKWYGEDTSRDWRIIPQLRKLPLGPDRMTARMQLGLSQSDFLTCSFGFVATTKLPEAILEGWRRSKVGANSRCRLIFVGGCFDQGLEAKIRRQARESGITDRVQITGYVPRQVYEQYLSAADLVIQLRTRSRGETSRPVLDSLAWGLPTVVNAHGWMAELPDEVVLKLPENVSASHVAEALDKLYGDPELCRRLKEGGRAYVKEVCTPGKVAEQYFQAIEHFAKNSWHARRSRLIQAIAKIDNTDMPKDEDLVAVAKSIVANQERRTNTRQVIVDISTIAQTDYGTDIQRVTRAHLKNLLKEPPEGWRIEPAYAVPPSAYRYVRAFTSEYLCLPSLGLPDDIVEVNTGDIFLGLDLTAHIVPDCTYFFTQLKAKGVQIYFVVFDLIPVRHPEWYPPEMYPMFTRWLETITRLADGIICISRSVADQLLEWLEKAYPCRVGPLKIGYFHLGADAESASPPRDKAADPQTLELLAQKAPIFLMVGTIEPRKGYAQVLAAFEHLWQSGVDISLVIVGKKGWMTEPLIKWLRTHPQKGQRLFWLEAISDKTLLKLYPMSTALLMASHGEGFGLPLIEAARHGLPIIARDIPVFREVCGDHAFYFTGDKPEDLAEAISTWLDLYRKGKAPSVEGMKVLTWEESTRQLLDIILHSKWYKVWKPK